MATLFIVSSGATRAGSERDVVINELMWDATEYVELLNTTDEAMSLSGWVLTRQKPGGEEKIIITFDEEVIIPATGFLLMERNEDATTVAADVITSSLTLVNSGELVTLKDETGAVIDQANQLGSWFAGENTSEGVAMERADASASGVLTTSWHTSIGAVGDRNGTPGAANSMPAVNQPPTGEISAAETGFTGAAIIFVAKNVQDPDGDTVTLAWSFGDGGSATGTEVTHTYTVADSFAVSLSMSDGVNETEATHTIAITKRTYSDHVTINEFLVNPTGSDAENEFIELINNSDDEVDIGGWQLDDKEGGSSPYTIPADTKLPGRGIRSFPRTETKIALNNTGDTARLLDPESVTKFSFTYSGAVPEGESHNRENDTFVLSTTPTPGEANKITDPPADDEEDDEPTPSPTSSDGAVGGATIVTVPLADVRTYKGGTVISTEGVVSAPPGVLGDTSMYIAGSGIQIYFRQGEYPALALGDTIAITGTMSSSLGEARIKIAAATDVAMKSHGDPPQPHIVSTGDIGEKLEGSLVLIQGTVTKTSGATFYVDDGSGEIKVFIKSATGIDKPRMRRGNLVTIIGVVSQTTTGYRVLPRFQEDVQLGAVAGFTSFPATGIADHTSSARVKGFALTVIAAMVLLALGYRSEEPLLNWHK